ncbi:MAG: hypothetical protein J6S58_02460 [Lentisphaeria bacterium]|nr:hypothetical protein [Lentisphaeria bacterium]
MSENLPGNLNFVGIGGIGMSGLAQMARALSCEVSGSDRALNAPENAEIFQALSARGSNCILRMEAVLRKGRKPEPWSIPQPSKKTIRISKRQGR